MVRCSISVQVEESKPVAVTGKRPFDHEDEESSQKGQNLRYHKRARIQISEPRTKGTKAMISTISEKRHQEFLTLKDSCAQDDAPQRISFVPKGSKISSQNIKLFEGRIVPQPQTLALLPTTPDNKLKTDEVMPC